VLSESSLFVYPSKWVLKTCGTTRLLNSVPRLLELAASIGLQPVRCKFSRATFLFPDQQHFPHTSFDDEVQFLDSQFAEPIGSAGNAYVLGDPDEGLQWHKYVAGRAIAEQATYNVELCMTELCEEACKQFFRNESFVSAEQTTRDSGIVHLKPNAVLDDYVFEPCGYSMNGIDGTGLITIHITPEAKFSYASVEVSGYAEDVVDVSYLLETAAKIFRPGKIAMALSIDQVSASNKFGALEDLPSGYGCPHASAKRLECGGAVTYLNMVRGEKGCPGSPVSLHHVASLHHVNSCLSVFSAVENSDNNSEEQELEQEQDMLAGPNCITLSA